MNTHDLTKREFCDVIGTPIVALLDPPCLDLAVIPEMSPLSRSNFLMGTDIVDSDVEDDGMSSEERRLDQSTSTLYAELMEVDESHVTRSSRPKLRDWLLAFYSEHNRCKIDEIDTIMERYKGREASFVRNLEKKYAPPRYKVRKAQRLCCNYSRLLTLRRFRKHSTRQFFCRRTHHGSLGQACVQHR
tara:strand:- start:3112 stop:3675 length:564 start_codon:yes stop_codon:yes gene_type:complete